MKQSICAALAAASLGFALTSTPSFAADGDETALTNLVALASQRLALAEPVARWKWAHHKPISDPRREAVVLGDVTKRAAAAGVDADYARAFFEDQIAASKDVQDTLFAHWRSGPAPTGTPPDLATSTRPALDRLTKSMIAGLALVAPLRNAPDCPSLLARSIANWKALTRYDSSQSAPLGRALSHVCAAGRASMTG